MSPTQSAITLAIEAICGVAGALGVRWWRPSLRPTILTTVLAGIVGGIAFTFIAAQIPGIGHLVGQVEAAADSVMLGIGGLTPTILIGVGVSGMLGGAILMAVLGLMRSG